MNTKLTLSINDKIIDAAKKVAKKRKMSLSRLVEYELAELIINKVEEPEITPFVASLALKPKDKNVSDRKLKEEYIDYLEKKYQ